MGSEITIRRSRRAVLGAALGGAAAVVASAAATPLPTLGADTEAAILGADNQSNTPTGFENLDPAEVSLKGTHAGTGAGLYGTSGDVSNAVSSPTEAGIYGFSDSSFFSAGVWGDSYQGVGVVGTADWGVYGIGGSAGVVGDADTTGLGVMGYSGAPESFPSMPAGVGVFAAAGSPSQIALQVSGRVRFSRSGRVPIGATSTSRKVTLSGVSTSTYVIATMQTNVSGLYVRAVVTASGSFTIYLSKAPGKTVYVGYMIIN